MSALNSLPLPVVRLLAFFHEELSERRPGRVPQTVQLWVGCLLVILISMTFEIPFVALSLAVLFYGIQSNAFYTKFVAILFVVATVLEIGSLFLIYKWSYGEPLIRLIIAGPILMGCMFLMRTHRLGLVFFAVAIVAIYGQTFPAMLDYPEVVVRLTLWCIVVGLYPTLLMTLIGVLWFPSRAITQMHQALNDRLDDAISHLTDSLAPLPETRIEREALALDNALQPDRAGQFADALEKYAAGLATALSRSPQITLEETPASQAILPTLLKQEQHVCQLFARLPDWTAPALTPAKEQAQGATQ
ncbi:TPA: fusaric acid resistance family protein [Escherichia coli]|nr:fusaric acid resistance family protein [Escherichia coli]